MHLPDYMVLLYCLCEIQSTIQSSYPNPSLYDFDIKLLVQLWVGSSNVSSAFTIFFFWSFYMQGKKPYSIASMIQILTFQGNSCQNTLLHKLEQLTKSMHIKVEELNVLQCHLYHANILLKSCLQSYKCFLFLGEIFQVYALFYI